MMGFVRYNMLDYDGYFIDSFSKNKQKRQKAFQYHISSFFPHICVIFIHSMLYCTNSCLNIIFFVRFPFIMKLDGTCWNYVAINPYGFR